MISNLFNIPDISTANVSSLFNADRLPIDGSTCLKSIGIDEDNGRLEIEFNDNAIYQYDCHGTESAVMDDILDADSRGQYFYYHVRKDYPYYKIKGRSDVLYRSPHAGQKLDWHGSFTDSSKPFYKLHGLQKWLHDLGLSARHSAPKRAEDRDWSDIR